MANSFNQIPQVANHVVNPVSNFFRSRLNYITKAITNAVAASAIQGSAANDINKLIQNFSGQMIGQVAEKVIDESVSDAVADSLIEKIIDDLSDEAIAETLNTDAITTFGNDPIPPEIPDGLVAAIDPGTEPQNPEVPDPEIPPTPPVDVSTEPPKTESTIPATTDEAKNKRKAEGLKLAEDARANQAQNDGATDNPLPTAPPPEGNPNNLTTAQAEGTKPEIPSIPSVESPLQSPLTEPVIPPNPQPPVESTQTTPTTENTDQTETKSETTSESTPEAVPAEPPKDLMNADTAEPLVKTDENGLPIAETKNGQAKGFAGLNEAANQTPSQATGLNAAEGEQTNPNEQNPETQASAQIDPNHGKIEASTPPANPNQPAIDELTQKMKELEQEENKIQKEIKKFSDEIKPIEAKISQNKLRIRALRTAWISIIVVSAILAITIIFFFLIPPIASWSWPLRRKIGEYTEDNKDLEKEIQKKKDKIKEKKSELEKIIKKHNELGRDRYKLLRPTPAATT